MSATATPPPAASSPQSRGFGAKRVLLLVFGSIVTLIALALLAGGGAAIWGLSQRDDSGYFSTGTHRVTTPTYAFASDTLDMGPDLTGWFGKDFATVRIQATSARPVFLAVGPASDVQRYLGNVQHREITDFDTDPFRVTSHGVPGTTTPAPPASQPFWRVRASGTGTQTIRWPVESGKWSAVAMNSDGSRGVSVGLKLGAKVDGLRWVGIGLLAGGALVLILGGTLIYFGARTPRDQSSSSQGTLA